MFNNYLKNESFDNINLQRNLYLEGKAFERNIKLEISVQTEIDFHFQSFLSISIRFISKSELQKLT